MTNGNRQRNQSPILKVIAAIIIIIGLATGIFTYDDIVQYLNSSGTNTESVQAPENVTGTLEVAMIDVGQADSFLISQDGHYALIDFGTVSTGKDVVSYLQEKGITNLDFVIGTHPHDDHMGGMEKVLGEIETSRVIIPNVKSSLVTANWYISLRKELKKSKYEVIYPKLGDTFTLGEATLKVIGPVDYSGSNINNYSIVIKLTYGTQDIIFTGDAEAEIEKQILDSGELIDAEVLKVGHHGSDTSNTEEWIDAISPDYALISCKLGNKYNHPIKSTMNTLKSRKIIVYRTDESGTVVMTITQDNISFDKKPGDYLSGEELEKRSSKWFATFLFVVTQKTG